MPKKVPPQVADGRHKDFAERLVQVCDNNPKVPPLGYGRQTWIAQQFQSMFSVRVPTETIRKWLSAESRPYNVKLTQLAHILGVDPVFLAVGHVDNLDPRQRKIRNAEADGVVNLVAGLIQMDGGHPAFPDEDDAQAKTDKVDMYAVIKGAKYNIHIALARPTETGYDFTIPRGAERCLILGVIRTDPFCVEIFDLDPEAAAAVGVTRALTNEISMDRDFKSGDHAWRRIESFAQRL